MIAILHAPLVTVVADDKPDKGYGFEHGCLP